jgi:serine/threonine protein kinase/tetratricopeptide (TPR) repeat protein
MTAAMIGETLGHYEIASLLGEGGMGSVYLARDQRLRREIALKVLPAKIAGDSTRLERFRREARSLAALNHPNIVTVYSVEEAGGVHFMTMELVDGRTLTQEVPVAGLALERFFALAVPLADALAEAHDHGIVHRDLKPANVLIDRRGRVKVLDFGLAKLTEAAVDDQFSQLPTEALTSDGMIVGTVPYMSPEQIEGQVVDHRSDIFSLGSVLYEMLTGGRAFSGSSQAALMSAILRDMPSSVTHSRREVPPRLDLLIGRCLEKDPRRRYQSVHDIRHELEAIRADGSSAVPFRVPPPASAAGLTPASGTTSRAEEMPSVAVLPFRNMSADPENEYFSDGLAEELINSLTKIERLRVPALSSSFQYKETTPSPKVVAEELGVATIVQGSVRRAGNRVRISAQLIDTSSGMNIWSEIFDRDLDDIFAIQDEVARAIADKLEVELVAGSGSAPIKRYTDNRQAYDLYLKGRFHVGRRDATSLRTAADCFERALALDPEYTLARVGLADVHWSQAIYNFVDPKEYFEKARLGVRQALEQDPDLPEAHASRGVVAMFQGRWEDADEAFARAIALREGFGFAHAYWAFSLGMQVRIEEMEEQIRLALEAEPESQFLRGLAAVANACANRWEETIHYARAGLEIDVNSLLSQWTYGLACCQTGQFDEAVSSFQRAVEISGGGPTHYTNLACACILAGRERDAEVFIEQARSTLPETIRSWALFPVDMARGDREKAHALLERALDEGATPFWACTWGRPFPDLLEKVGVPPE